MIGRLITFPLRYGFSKLKRAIGKLDRVQIEPLYVFGNEYKIYVKARVVEAYKQSIPSEKKLAIRNLLAAIRRYSVSSVPDVDIIVRFGYEKLTLTSDGEGIIDGQFKVEVNEEEEEKIGFSFAGNGDDLEHNPEEVFFPVTRYASNHSFGIISDIDDTILVSKATQIGKKFWLSISKNAYTRRPFPGISKFYKGLTRHGENPVFYVSSSDWNLNELIKDFLEYRKIPQGPLLLKDLHINLKNIWKSGGGSHSHKSEKIQFLFKLYPKMKFILIGDSGQHDPELYAEAIESFPDRVLAVYIRIIKNMDEERRNLLDQYSDRVAIAYVHNTHEAIDHALANGFIKYEHV